MIDLSCHPRAKQHHGLYIPFAYTIMNMGGSDVCGSIDDNERDMRRRCEIFD